MIEPQIPQNTGNIARTCAATGSRLHLVKPLGFQINDKQLKRAGLDYWHLLDITYYDSLADFFRENTGEFYYFTTKGKNVYSNKRYNKDTYLVFGREDKGLPEELLHNNPDFCVRLPMISTSRSLNLSNSVAVAVYEVLRQWDFPNLMGSGQLTKFSWEK